MTGPETTPIGAGASTGLPQGQGSTPIAGTADRDGSPIADTSGASTPIAGSAEREGGHMAGLSDEIYHEAAEERAHFIDEGTPTPKKDDGSGK